MKRREIKEAHENSVLNSFVSHLKNVGRDFTVLCTPDPPDAIGLLDQIKTWVEITDAFISDDFARSLSSYAPVDVLHTPCGKTKVIDPDATLSEIVRSVVTAKYEKASIKRVFDEIGPGILLVGLFSPFIDQEEIIVQIENVINLCKGQDDRFREIYLYDFNHKFYRAL